MKNRSDAKKNNFRNAKLAVMGVMFTMILAGLLVRVVYIKSVYGESYERRAVEQDSTRKNTETVLTARRGNIFDRNKQSLALSYAVDNVVLDISEMVKETKRSDKGKEAIEKTVENLSKYLDIPAETINGYLATDENGVPLKNVRYFVLAKNVDRKITSELMASGVKCVYTEEGSIRSYTHNNLLSQVLGFAQGWGLELEYNKALSGVNGRYYRVYNTNSSADISKDEAIDGYSLVTTIDTVIQQYAEAAIKHSNEQFEAQTTSCIVMNPKTGEVLAMAQYPPFNNNKPMNFDEIGGVNDDTGLMDMRFKTELEALPESEQMDRLMNIWTNFNVSSSIEPGSIYKPVVVAAALEENMISTDSTYFCGGSDDLTGLPCHQESGHGSQTLTQVLANSCNVGMTKIAREMGKETYFKYHKDFGYGEKTGIDLPGEASFSSLQYSLAQLDHPMYIGTSSFGQGFNATPIQSINAFSAIINGGNLMKPYVVSQVVDNKGNVIKENFPTVQRKVLSQQTSDWMRKALLSVVTPEGTGRKAVIKGYAMGGKTGTSQQGIRHEDKSLDEWALSFVAYLPAEDPDIVALVIIDKPFELVDGVTTPAYMMKELMENIIKYKGLLPSDDTSEANNIHVTKDSIELSDLVGLSSRDATHYLNNSSLNYVIIGNGNTVVSQMPNAGSMVSKGTVVYLTLTVGEDDPASDDLVLIPNVTDIPAAQAFDILTSIGLTPIVFGTETAVAEPDAAQVSPMNEGEPQDVSTEIVFEQMPLPNIKVQKGTEIKLTVK